jgi:hypothetical protein
MEITLTPELERFVADEIADGAFKTPQDLMLALLAFYREKKLAVMRREIMVGVEQADRGETYELTEEAIAELKAEIERELAEEGFGDGQAASQPPGASGPKDHGQGTCPPEQVSVGSIDR